MRTSKEDGAQHPPSPAPRRPLTTLQHIETLRFVVDSVAPTARPLREHATLARGMNDDYKQKIDDASAALRIQAPAAPLSHLLLTPRASIPKGRTPAARGRTADNIDFLCSYSAAALPRAGLLLAAPLARDACAEQCARTAISDRLTKHDLANLHSGATGNSDHN